MKKRSLFVAAYLAMGAALMFTSCSNDEDIMNGGIVENANVQTLTLKVVNSGDKFASTRAGRPLVSSESGQEIDKVDFIVYQISEGADKGKIVLNKTLDWKKSSLIGDDQVSTDGFKEHGKYMTLELKGKDKLPAGKAYKIYAIGYTSENSSYGYGTNAPFVNATVGETYTKAYTATIQDPAQGPAADEVFAGEGEINVPNPNTAQEGQSGVTGNVVLRRQVTGTFGYFKNIPYQNIEKTKTGTKLRLVASGANKTITFENFSNSVTEDDDKVKYVVNGSDAVDKNAKFFGSTEKDGVVIYEAAFKDWFDGDIADLDTNNDGFISLEEGKDAWKKPAAYNDKATFMKGTMFASSFLVPVLKTNDHQTLQLQLVDGEDEPNILRYWNINLGEKEAQLNQTISTAAAEDASSYSLVRNHLYTVGEKLASNPGGTDPDPKPTPDPDDPDKPGDLSAGQNLIIKVNDNWEAVHNMVID